MNKLKTKKRLNRTTKIRLSIKKEIDTPNKNHGKGCELIFK